MAIVVKIHRINKLCRFMKKSFEEGWRNDVTGKTRIIVKIFRNKGRDCHVWVYLSNQSRYLLNGEPHLETL